jgi:hypothetical protein
MPFHIRAIRVIRGQKAVSLRLSIIMFAKMLLHDTLMQCFGTRVSNEPK